MAIGTIRRSHAAALLMCLLLAACASDSHVVAFQEAPIAAPRRVVTLALQGGETLPFGISSERIAVAVGRAGFVLRDDRPGYRLALTAASGRSEAGDYLPETQGNAPRAWVARPDRHWRTRFAGGHILRVSAVLIDMADNREVWRGTATLPTRDPKTAAPELVDELLAKLPRG